MHTVKRHIHLSFFSFWLFSEILARKLLTPFQHSCEYLHCQTACPENYYDRKISMIWWCCIQHVNISFVKEVKDHVPKKNISSVLAVESTWVKRHKWQVRPKDAGGKACHLFDLGPKLHRNVLKIYHIREEVWSKRASVLKINQTELLLFCTLSVHGYGLCPGGELFMALCRSQSSVSHDTTGKVSHRQRWSRKRRRGATACFLALFLRMQSSELWWIL